MPKYRSFWDADKEFESANENLPAGDIEIVGEKSLSDGSLVTYFLGRPEPIPDDIQRMRFYAVSSLPGSKPIETNFVTLDLDELILDLDELTLS